MARKTTRKAIPDNSEIIAKAINNYLQRPDAISASQVAEATPFYKRKDVLEYAFHIGKNIVICRYTNGVCLVKHLVF